MKTHSIPIFELGSIPSQRAWHGFPLSFQIDTTKLDPNSLAITPPKSLQGTINFTPADGIFIYSPHPQDLSDFSLTFSATKGNKEIEQSIVLTPRPHLLPEREIIRGKPLVPNPSDTFYFKRSVEKNADGSENHVLSGVTLHIGGAEDINRIHDMYHRDPSSTMPALPPEQIPWEGHVKNLTFCVDRLILHESFSVPETHVHLFARELIFVDSPDSTTQLITSPLPWSIQKAKDGKESDTSGGQGENGIHGRTAGNLHLHVRNLIEEGPTKVRFILDGGKGQDAGEGTEGENGKGFDYWTSDKVTFKSFFPFKKSKTVEVTFDPPATYVTRSSWDGSLGDALAIKQKNLPSYGNSKAKPTNATPGKRPGIPGNGGDSGQLKTQLSVIREVSSAKGGLAGKKAKDIPAYRGGYPSKWAHYDVRFLGTGPNAKGSRAKLSRKGKKHETKGTSPIPAPKAAVPVGQSLAPVIEGPTFAWLHTYQVQTLLQFIRDLYLADQIDEAEELLEEYLPALIHAAQSGQSKAGIPPLSAEKMKSEAINLLQRLSSNLDYFGNPLGWTPLFSLKAHLQLFDKEVNAALRTLLLTRVVQQKKMNAESKANMMTQLIETLDEDTREAVEEISQAEEELDRVSNEISSLETDLQTLQNELMEVREQLRVKAANDLEKKAKINFAAKTLSAICMVVPVGQPVLGLVGSLAPVIAGSLTEESDDLDTVGEGFRTISQWTQGSGQETFKHWAGEVKKEGKPTPNPDEKKAQKKAERINHVGKHIGPALMEVSAAIAALKVPETEVQAELEKLAADSPEFKEIIEKIIQTGLSKSALVERLEKVLQLLGNAYARMMENYLAVAEMAREKRESISRLNHHAFLYLKEIEQRARQRLAKYQYFMIRAYESTTFEPYDEVDYRLSKVFDGIAGMLEELGESDSKTPIWDRSEELKPLFRGILDEIEDRLVEGFRTEYTYEREYRLSKENTPELLDQLNKKGKALMNLTELNPYVVLIPPKKERVKLENINVSDMQFEAHSQDSGSVEISFTPVGEGTLRSDGHLYTVHHPSSSGLENRQHSRSQLLWGSVYNLSDKSTSHIQPSKESLELLRYLIQDSSSVSEDQLASLAKPAAWIDLEIQLDRPLGVNLESLTIKFSFQSTPVIRDHYTLDIRTFEDREPLIQCDKEDVKNRKDGMGDFYRIYPRSNRLMLSAPPRYGSLKFDHWRILNLDQMNEGNPVYTPDFEVSPDTNFRLTCVYTSANGKSPEELSNGKSREESKKASDFAKGYRGKLYNMPCMDQGEVIGFIPDSKLLIPIPEERESSESQVTWMKVDFQGILGWIPIA